MDTNEVFDTDGRYWTNIALACQRQGVLPPGATSSSSSDDGDDVELPEPPEIEEVPF